MSYLKNVLSQRATPQSQAIPGTAQVPNSAGGFAWAVDDWTRVDRFLVLGSEGGSYYASQQRLTLENAQAVQQCVRIDGLRLVARIVEISQAGRAPKNDPAIFALAVAASQGDPATRAAALVAVPKVCRTGTHLFHFAQFVDGMRGWGRGLRTAIGGWYVGQDAKSLVYQAVKYQQRDGWSHRDLLRLAHPKPPTETHRRLFRWITQGDAAAAEPELAQDAELELLAGTLAGRNATTAEETAALIRRYRLPREAVTTEWLTHSEVWDALLDSMPMTALIRNLATMTRVGLLAPKSDAVKRVVAQLGNGEWLTRARVHPIAVLGALKTYAQGHGERGRGTWTPVKEVVEALDAAFYASFGNVERTDKRWYLALDVSGSMGVGVVAGMAGLTPRVASAAMALVTAATEPEYYCAGFTSRGQRHGTGNAITPLEIGRRMRLDTVLKVVENLPFGGTDCALPMLDALQRKLPVDVFVIYTDSETWAGSVHPVQALREYRQRMGIPAKLVVVGMVSNGFTIADPNDGGMLDVVGFDTATPNVMSDFARA